MGDSLATAQLIPTVRRMRWDDLPGVLEIARRPPPSAWLRADFLTVFQSNETIGHVAEIRKRMAGFALCLITRPKPVEADGGPLLLRLLRRLTDGRRYKPRQGKLFGLAVVSHRAHASIEKALLAEIVREFGQPGDNIRALAPETRLAAQLFMRDVGFQALSISKHYYGSEDGYLMVRHSSHSQTKSQAVDQEQYSVHGICSNGDGGD